MAINRAAAAFLVGLVAVVGCDPDRPPGLSKRNAKMEDVPAVVLKAAETKIPGVKFNEVWKNLDREGKLHSYEIRGRNKDGKIREARVAPTGEVLEVE